MLSDDKTFHKFYQLSGTSISSLISHLSDMLSRISKKDGKWWFQFGECVSH